MKHKIQKVSAKNCSFYSISPPKLKIESIDCEA